MCLFLLVVVSLLLLDSFLLVLFVLSSSSAIQALAQLTTVREPNLRFRQGRACSRDREVKKPTASFSHAGCTATMNWNSLHHQRCTQQTFAVACTVHSATSACSAMSVQKHDKSTKVIMPVRNAQKMSTRTMAKK